MKRQSLRFVVVIMLTLTVGASMVLLAAPRAGLRCQHHRHERQRAREHQAFHGFTFKLL